MGMIDIVAYIIGGFLLAFHLCLAFLPHSLAGLFFIGMCASSLSKKD